MGYDLFIIYSRKDRFDNRLNQPGWMTALIDALRPGRRRVTTQDRKIFFDTGEILVGQCEHVRQRIELFDQRLDALLARIQRAQLLGGQPS